MSPVKIIAEAGVNHNGSAKMAFELVDAAVYAGADAEKFHSIKMEWKADSIKMLSLQQSHLKRFTMK